MRHAGANSHRFGGDYVCLDRLTGWNCDGGWLICTKNPFSRFQQPPDMKGLQLGMKSAHNKSDLQIAYCSQPMNTSKSLVAQISNAALDEPDSFRPRSGTS